jgi:aminoglycoside phosphotransferase (APT) family kinase protein
VARGLQASRPAPRANVMQTLTTLVDQLAPGASIERTWPLVGGVSASVVAVIFTRPDGVQERVVVRRRQAHQWKPGEPGGMTVEHDLLARLHERGLPVARPRLLDASGALVIDFIDGTTDLPAEPTTIMAATLAQIHATPLDGLPALPERDDPLPELLEWLGDSPELGRALEQRGRFCGPARLLHGDYWPGNLLWRDGLLVAVLDWEDAAIGDPLSDLACARAELACAADEAITQSFTTAYLQQTGIDASRLPVWDLYVSTASLMSMDQWGLPPDKLAGRRDATQAFRDRAAALLGPAEVAAPC